MLCDGKAGSCKRSGCRGRGGGRVSSIASNVLHLEDSEWCANDASNGSAGFHISDLRGLVLELEQYISSLECGCN